MRILSLKFEGYDKVGLMVKLVLMVTRVKQSHASKGQYFVVSFMFSLMGLPVLRGYLLLGHFTLSRDWLL